MPHRLSKSRYTAGVQCHKLLWWKVHEPKAKELQPGIVLQDRFDQGAQVGALARERFPGGVLVDLPYYAVDERVTRTRQLIDAGAPAIFEASFLADNTHVMVDVLTRQDGGFHLTEVKSSSSQKEEHLPDAAVQVHVLERSGIHITGVDIMHLSKECHFPDLSNLFERTDVTEAVAPLLGNPKPEEVVFADQKVSAGSRSMTWKEACASLPAAGITGHGEWRSDLRPSRTAKGRHPWRSCRRRRW